MRYAEGLLFLKSPLVLNMASSPTIAKQTTPTTAPAVGFWMALWAFIRSTSIEGIAPVFKKELIQLFRDKFLVAFIITLPIIQLVVTGLAIQRDLQHVPTIVCNYDKHNASFELLKALRQSNMFDLDERGNAASEAQVLQAIRQGKYKVGIVIPPDYSRNLLSGRSPANVMITIDGSQATVAKSIQGNMMGVIQEFSKNQLAQQSLLSGNGLANQVANFMTAQTQLVKPAAQILYNPDMKSSIYLIPGILAIIMHIMTILFTSFAIVRERETGTLEQLLVTPIRVSDLMLGKVIPYAVIGFVDMLLTLGVMVLFFQIPISGSFWFLCIASIIFILTSLAVGLLISATCRSQVQAVQLTLGLIIPSLLLSGFVFPLEPMPMLVKWVSYTLPLTYYLEIIRGVVIKGIGMMELWRQLLWLSVISVVLISTAVVRFKKQVA